MKITSNILKKIIIEELETVLKEQPMMGDPGRAAAVPPVDSPQEDFQSPAAKLEGEIFEFLADIGDETPTKDQRRRGSQLLMQALRTDTEPAVGDDIELSGLFKQALNLLKTFEYAGVSLMLPKSAEAAVKQKLERIAATVRDDAYLGGISDKFDDADKLASMIRFF